MVEADVDEALTSIQASHFILLCNFGDNLSLRNPVIVSMLQFCCFKFSQCSIAIVGRQLKKTGRRNYFPLLKTCTVNIKNSSCFCEYKIFNTASH